MKHLIAVLLVACVVQQASGAPDEKTMGEALALRERGEFEKATQLLQSYLEQTSASMELADRRAVEFEVERIRRIRMDYQQTREQVIEQLRGRVPDFTEEEFNAQESAGHIDSMVIDGQKFYVNSTVSNLLMRVKELGARRQPAPKPGDTYRKMYAQMKRVMKARGKSRDMLVCPQDYEVTFTLIVNANAAPEGRTVRCWLPFVRMFPFQTDAYIMDTEPAEHVVAPPEHPHRTIYMERPAMKDHATTFSAHFIYRCWARATDVDPEAVQPYRKDAPEYAYYTADRKPHLDLANEELRKLNADIVNGETNPYLIAKRIYNWIAENTIYQYAREYSTLDNISYYVASRRAGDCGQHAMLFIALCRMNGIPARWQSGWESYTRYGGNMHDWCEFYVEPYGWLPADPDMAVNLRHLNDNELDTTRTQELMAWWFGNMDHSRMAVNCDFSAPLFPEKNDFRSETVDFQRGEAECDGRNLYFNQWDYSFRIRPIPAEKAAQIAAQFLPPPVDLPPAPEPAPKPAAVETSPTVTTPKPDKAATSATVQAAEPTTATAAKSDVTSAPATPAPTPVPAPTPKLAAEPTTATVSEAAATSVTATPAPTPAAATDSAQTSTTK